MCNTLCCRFATIHRPLSTKPTAVVTPPATSVTPASAAKPSNLLPKKSQNGGPAPASAASLNPAIVPVPAAKESEDEFHLVNLSEEEPDLGGLFDGLSDDDLGM